LVKPLIDPLHKGLSERAFSKCVLDGVLSPQYRHLPSGLFFKSEQFFVCSYNSMDESKLKPCELSVLVGVFQRLENLALSIAIYW